MNHLAGRGLGAWSNIQTAIQGLSGWRRRGMAFFFGMLAVAALPPVHVLPVLLVSFTGLVWLTDGCPTWRTAIGNGWWFGLGYHVAGLYWISFALLVEPEKFGWMIPFAIFGLSAAFAVYCGLAVLLAWLCRCTGPGRVLVLAAAWTAMEWFRGVAFTGFPWNSLGIVWTPFDGMIQLASVTGVFGLTLITVIVAAAPALVSGDPESRRWLPLAAVGVLLGVVWAGGIWRLDGAGEAMVPGVKLRLVQANISQRLKWRPELRGRHFAQYLALSRSGEGVTHVIWPETAAPFVVANDSARRRIMASVIPPGGLLLTGSIRTTPRGITPFRVWNSLHAIDRNGRITATYDKFHLVPFGEYVPFRSLLDFTKLTAGRTDFSRGSGPRTLVLEGLPPVSPLICYEAIFPGRVVDPAARPGWLLNVTNDAWFGISSGPYQHFASARFRSVEEGLPLVRAANTGISAVVDSYGRIVAKLDLGVQGVLDAPLPQALATPPPFARFGGWILFALIAGTAAAGRFWRGRA